MKVETMVTAIVVSLILFGGLTFIVTLAIKKERNKNNGSTRND
ncbi:MAG: hypothetical protein Fur0015_01640 [Ignavibacteriales bacterium]